MNRDLLLGMLVPGRDRFEVRGWVRWLLGDPKEHVPTDPVDRARFERLHRLDDADLESLRKTALASIDETHIVPGSAAYLRGIASHDALMNVLLRDPGNPDSIRLSVFREDSDRLLDMLHIDQSDLDNEEFHQGFQWANRALSDAVSKHLI